jgi:hypothetical protein
MRKDPEIRPAEARSRARESADHVFGCLKQAIREDRKTSGHSEEFELLILVEPRTKPVEPSVSEEAIESFMNGASLGHLENTGLILMKDHQALCDVFCELHGRGEHDTSYCDCSRPDATLLHVGQLPGRASVVGQTSPANRRCTGIWRRRRA